MDRPLSAAGRALKRLALVLVWAGTAAAQQVPPADPPWSPAVKIGTDLPSCWSAENAQMAVDPGGNAYAVWLHDTASVKVSRFDAARGTWSEPLRLSGGPAGPAFRLSAPTIDVDNLGNAVVAWVQQNTASPSYSVIWAARYEPAHGAWGGAQVVSHMDGSLAHSPQVVAIGGHAALTWVRDDSPFGLADSVWWANLFRDRAAWGVPFRVDSPYAPAGKVTGLRMAVGPDFQTALVWSKNGTRYPGVPVIWASLGNLLNAPGPASVISNDWLDPETAPQVAITFSGHVHVAWQQSGPGVSGDGFRNIWTVRHDRYEGWAPRRLVSGLYDKTSSLRLVSFNRTLGMRNAMVGWIEPGTPAKVWAAHLFLDEVTPPQLVTTATPGGFADGLTLAVDAHGNAEAAWSVGPVRSAARYRRSSGQWGAAEVLEAADFGVTANGPLAVNASGVSFTGYGVRTGPGHASCVLIGRRHD